MFKLDNVEDDKKTELKSNTSYTLNKKNIVVDKSDEYEDELKDFIEIQKDEIQKIQKNDFIRYVSKKDNELKKGGYVLDIYSKVSKKGEEKIYIKLSFNKTIMKNSAIGVYNILLDNISNIYKKIHSPVEYNIIKNSINGVSSHMNDDIRNLYDTISSKDTELELLKKDIKYLKDENKKNEERIRKIVGYIKDISNKLNSTNNSTNI